MSQRLNLVVSDKTVTKLEALVEKTDADNKTDVVRRALSLYSRIVEDLEVDGSQLVLRRKDSDGHTVSEDVLLIV